MPLAVARHPRATTHGLHRMTLGAKRFVA